MSYGIRSPKSPRISYEQTQNIIASRKMAKISQERVAAVLDVTRRTICNWETNPFKPNMPEEVYALLLDYYSNPKKYEGDQVFNIKPTAYINRNDRISEEEQQLEFEARERANVSRESAATLVGVTPTCIKNWEEGFYWEPKMPREIYNRLMQEYESPANHQRRKRRAAKRCRVSENERLEMIKARKEAGLSLGVAADEIGRSRAVVFNWEEVGRANAPRTEYDKLMRFYASA